MSTLITELINPVNLTNLELIPREFSNTALSIIGDNTHVNLGENSLNTIPSSTQYILINMINMNITDLSYIVNVPTSDIIILNPSGDKMYSRFLESSQRMIEHIVKYNISISNVENPSIIKRGNLLNTNHLNGGYLYYMAYLAFMFYKAHKAYYLALIYMLVRYLSSNKFSLYLFLLMLQARPVAGANIALANKLIFAMGWFLYINLMGIYDLVFKNIQSTHVSQTLFANGRINSRFLRRRLFLGGLFAFVINIGVLFSSCFAYITIPFLNLRAKIIATVASYIISTLASTGWLYATRRELLGYGLRALTLSYFRSLLESLAFNALSYANFIIWSFLPKIFISYVTTFVLGLVLYFIVSFFQIMLETNLDHKFLYGFMYNFVFTFLSISSSGLYFLMNITNLNLPLKLGLMLLSLIIVILLPLEVYRFTPPSIRLGERGGNNTLLEYLIGRQRANNPIIRHLVSILYQLIVFFAFAIGTFIWLDLTGLAG